MENKGGKDYKSYIMERIEIRLKEDLSDEFKDFWTNNVKHFMKKGWETWVASWEWNINSVMKINIHPEDNLYEINFPREMFEEIQKQ